MGAAALTPPPPPGFTLDQVPPPPPGFTMDAIGPQSIPDAVPQPKLDTGAAPSMLSVVKDAAYKGAAGVPDALLNAPNRVMNLGRAAIGTAATAMGRPDMAPEVTPDPGIVRGALEKIGLIKNVEPKGFAQKAASVVTEGATGGALTGGASLPRTIAGAGMGALSTSAADVTGRVTGSPEASIAAGLLAPRAAAKAVGGGRKLSPEVEILNNEGVSLTPGQILGGTAKRVEDAATSIPLLGDFIKNAQVRGHETFGAAAINRGLKPIGDKLPPGTKGRDAIAYAQDKLGTRFDDIAAKSKGSLDGPISASGLPQIGAPGANAQPTLRAELDSIRALAANSKLPQAQRDQLDRILDNEIIARFTQQGMASGETIQNIDSTLGRLAADLGRSDNYDVRTLSGAVKESQAAVRRMQGRENPTHADESAQAREGWANFKKAQDAASQPQSRKGVFTPTTLHSAARRGDKSKDKADFANDDALMQDLSGAGKAVLTSSVPDSGTPLRVAVGAAGLGGIEHFLSPGVAAGLGAATLAYTSPAQRIAQAILAGPERPAISEAALRSLIPLAEEVDSRPWARKPKQKRY